MKTLTTLLLMAAAALTACTQEALDSDDDAADDGTEQTITFGIDEAATRASSGVTLDSLKKTGFYIVEAKKYASQTDYNAGKYTDILSCEKTPVKVTWNATKNAWTYSGTKKWDTYAYMYVFTAAHYKEVWTAKTYTMPSNPTTHKDILYTVPQSIPVTKFGKTVQFTFNHAFARIGLLMDTSGLSSLLANDKNNSVTITNIWLGKPKSGSVDVTSLFYQKANAQNQFNPVNTSEIKYYTVSPDDMTTTTYTTSNNNQSFRLNKSNAYMMAVKIPLGSTGIAVRVRYDLTISGATKTVTYVSDPLMVNETLAQGHAYDFKLSMKDILQGQSGKSAVSVTVTPWKSAGRKVITDF